MVHSCIVLINHYRNWTSILPIFLSIFRNVAAAREDAFCYMRCSSVQ
uniref:Uncharacterized protein n=1 Tax=Arundo donax TaxID=35708 RepID=A0A0A8Z5R4_ARUDO